MSIGKLSFATTLTSAVLAFAGLAVSIARADFVAVDGILAARIRGSGGVAAGGQAAEQQAQRRQNGNLLRHLFSPWGCADSRNEAEK